MNKIEQYIKQMIKTNFKYYILIGILGVIKISLIFYNIQIIKSLINLGILGQDKLALYHYFTLNIINMLILSFISFSKKTIEVKNNVFLLYQTRMFFLKEFSQLEYSEIVKQDISLLIKRINEDSRYIFGFYSSCIEAIISIIYLTLGSFYLLIINLQTGLLITFIIFIYIVLLIQFNKKYKDKLKSYLKEQDSSFKYLTESLKNLELLNYFENSIFFLKRYSKQYRSFKDANQERLIYKFIFDEIFFLIKNGLPMIIYLIGGLLVLNKQISYGTIIVFIMYINLILKSTNQLVDFNEHLQLYKESKRRLSEILSIKKKNQIKYTFNSIDNFELKGIYFKNILSNINFKINKGEIMLLSGINGSGKTLLMKIISGFIPADRGTFIINNKCYSPSEYMQLKKISSFIDSKSNFFQGNIKDNLKISRNNITNLEILNFFDILNLNPKIYNTHNVLNCNLSLGQFQKLRIIRGLIKEVPILCFDESFINLDDVSKSKILDYLKNQNQNFTFIVSHDIKIEQSLYQDNMIKTLKLEQSNIK